MQNDEPTYSEPRPFIVCNNCGQLIPSQAHECEYCGAVFATAEQVVEQQFLNDLFTRPAPVTPILIGVNLAIYIVMTFVAGGDFWAMLTGGADHSTLLAFGAQNNELLRNGEWFRLITPAFIHIGLLHLFMNSYVLWSIGPMVEKLYGTSRFLAIYLLTAAGGSFASFMNHSWKHDMTGASAGASGAIFGLFGVLAVFSFRYRNELPQRFLHSLKSGILPAIGINLVIGFSLKYVDNAAHIGGLLTGALLALVIPYIQNAQNRRNTLLGWAVLGLCLATILTCFAFAYRQSPLLLTRRLSKVEPFLNSLEAADEAMVSIYQAADKEGQENWKPSQQDIDRLTQATQTLKQGVAPDATTEEIRQGLLRAVQQQQQIITQPGDKPINEQLEPTTEEFLALRKRFTDWLKKDGPTYGFTFRDTSKDQKK
ncbi:MAG: rhomboid family intramembrane serine protease [Blastocatellia bacterium]